jgi:CRP-like cAMP-binding protein
MQVGFAFSKLADRLNSVSDLSDDDVELLAAMPGTVKHFGTHHHVLRRGDDTSHCCLLLQGYSCWRDDEGSGGQIVSIQVPGDVPDLSTIHGSRITCNLVTLGPAVVIFVPHAFFREISEQSPALLRSLLKLMLIDTSMLRNWVVNLGSRDALTRVAHLLCEIAMRLRAVGLNKDFQMPLPFTQSDLAAACGISAVHANRTIQELRRSGLLQWQAKTITIADWNGLVRLAEFSPEYLGLRHQFTDEFRLEPSPPQFHARNPVGVSSP